MPGIEFTDNYEDLSTGQGFQFRFRCERCGDCGAKLGPGARFCGECGAKQGG